ncbi:hypothetical protein EON66_10510, partial [archaeon]
MQEAVTGRRNGHIDVILTACLLFTLAASAQHIRTLGKRLRDWATMLLIALTTFAVALLLLHASQTVRARLGLTQELAASQALAAALAPVTLNSTDAEEWLNFDRIVALPAHPVLLPGTTVVAVALAVLMAAVYLPLKRVASVYLTMTRPVSAPFQRVTACQRMGAHVFIATPLLIVCLLWPLAMYPFTRLATETSDDASPLTFLHLHLSASQWLSLRMLLVATLVYVQLRQVAVWGQAFLATSRERQVVRLVQAATDAAMGEPVTESLIVSLHRNCNIDSLRAAFESSIALLQVATMPLIFGVLATLAWRRGDLSIDVWTLMWSVLEPHVGVY